MMGNMVHIFHAVLLFVVAVVLVVLGLTERTFMWFGAAVVVLLITKGLRSLLLFLYRSPGLPTKGFSFRDWRFVAGGYMLSAMLFLVSGLVGEEKIGFLAAPVMVVVSFVLWFVSKRPQTQANAGGSSQNV